MLLPWLVGHVQLRPTGQDGKELNMPFICEQTVSLVKLYDTISRKVIIATCADESFINTVATVIRQPVGSLLPNEFL